MQGQEMIWSNVALLRSMPHRLELSVIDKTLKNSKHTQNHFLTYKKIQQGVFWKFIEINSKKEIERYFFCNFYEIELFNFVSKINTIFLNLLLKYFSSLRTLPFKKHHSLCYLRTSGFFGWNLLASSRAANLAANSAAPDFIHLSWEIIWGSTFENSDNF